MRNTLDNLDDALDTAHISLEAYNPVRYKDFLKSCEDLRAKVREMLDGPGGAESE